MPKINLISLSILCLSAFAFAKSGQELANDLKLNPSSKAIKQWERVFSTPDKMQQAGIDKLSESDKSALKKYLLDHAADSDKPAVAGK